MRRRVRVGAVGVAVVAVAALSGCMSESDFAVLDTEPRAADAPPQAVFEDTEGTVDQDTARFVGKDGEVSLWLARPAESGNGICLIAYKSDDRYLTGCADGGSWIRIEGQEVGEYEVAPDGSPAPEGTERLFDNVFVPAG